MRENQDGDADYTEKLHKLENKIEEYFNKTNGYVPTETFDQQINYLK